MEKMLAMLLPSLLNTLGLTKDSVQKFMTAVRGMAQDFVMRQARMESAIERIELATASIEAHVKGYAPVDHAHFMDMGLISIHGSKVLTEDEANVRQQELKGE